MSNQPAQVGGILAWLDSAIRQREETARAAAALQDDPENGWGIVDDSSYAVPSKRRTISPHIGITHEPESAAHIVLNNPADVLRRCAADRKLLELHQAVPDHGRYSERNCPSDCDGEHSGPPVCASCRDYVGDPIGAPCPTALAIAEGYGWMGDER